MIDFEATGHHALYIRHLVRFGMADTASITFLISRELSGRVLHQLSDFESGLFLKRLRIIEDERAWRRIRRWIGHEKLARFVYVEHLNFFEGRKCILFFLFLENVFYVIAFSPLPRFHVCGLMFRPTFYYRQRDMLERGIRSRAMFLVKSAAAYACVKRPGISRILALDPLAGEHARTRWNCSKFEVVPDPFGPEAGASRPLGIFQERERRSLTLLIAGVLSPRKGIREVVQALSSGSEELRRRVTLVIAGELDERHTAYITENIQLLRDKSGKVVVDLRLITEKELDAYIEASDAVLTAYRGFKGSSGILIRAAHFGKPVISTNEGLLGHFVRHYKLGQAIDVSDSREFAACLETFMRTGVLKGFDPATARRFADDSSPERFAEQLISTLIGRSPAIAG